MATLTELVGARAQVVARFGGWLAGALAHRR
jgi:hypothetical protein